MRKNKNLCIILLLVFLLAACAPSGRNENYDDDNTVDQEVGSGDASGEVDAEGADGESGEESTVNQEDNGEETDESENDADHEGDSGSESTEEQAMDDNWQEFYKRAAPIDVNDSVVFLKDVPYGDHSKMTYDILYMPEADEPSAVLFYLHGGGFIGGNKNFVYHGMSDVFEHLIENNIAVVNVNYRLLQDTGEDGVFGCLDDATYALQTIRYLADAFNINKEKIILSGSSAGGGTSLWIGLQDDMADLDNDDPIRHESTRVQGIAATETQATYDIRKWTLIFDDFGVMVENLESTLPGFNATVSAFVGGRDIDLSRINAPDDDMSKLDMLAMLSSDDPEIFVSNLGVMDVYPVTYDMLYHHPNHAEAIHEVGWDNDVKVTAYYENYQDPNGETYEEFIVRVAKGISSNAFGYFDMFESLPETSPDGTKLAYLDSYFFEGNSSLIVYDIESGTHTEVVSFEDGSDWTVRDFEWIDDETIYYTTSYAYGTIAQGGTLLSVNINTMTKTLIKRVTDYTTVKDINVSGNFITLNHIRYDDEYINAYSILQEYTKDELPLKEIYINEDTGQGVFYLEVYAPIYDVRLASVIYDEENNELLQGDVLNRLQEAEKCVIMVDTLLPEGMPYQMLLWRDEEGGEHFVYISYNGRTGNHYVMTY